MATTVQAVEQDLLAERAQDIAAIATAETGATFGWGTFNVGLASSMLREAAAQTYALRGEVIPLAAHRSGAATT